LRGDCLVKRGDHLGALAAYHRALAIQPDYPEVQLQAAELYRIQGRYDRLLATVDRLQESLGTGDECPVRGQLLLRALHCGISIGHLEAQRCFAEASRGAPLDPEPHLQLADLYLLIGDLDAAHQVIGAGQFTGPRIAGGD
jgi:tetratricopeptide (TPR) repeat protein